MVTPSSAQILSAGASLELSCSMDIDDIYVTRAVTWKLDNGDDVSLSFVSIKKYFVLLQFPINSNYLYTGYAVS